MTLVDKTIKGFIVILFTVLVVSVTIQVFARMIGFTSAWTMEIATYSFVWLTFVGGYLTIQKGINITFDLIIDALPGKIWDTIFTFTNIISCLFLIFIGVIGTRLAMNMGSVSPVTHLPMSTIAFAMPVGAIVMLIAQIKFYFSHIKEKDESTC